MPVAAIAAQLRRGERQHRTQPLAAAVDQVVREFRDHLDVGNRFIEDNAINSLEVIRNQGEKRFQLLARLAKVIQWYHTAQVDPHSNAGMLLYSGNDAAALRPRVRPLSFAECRYARTGYDE